KPLAAKQRRPDLFGTREDVYTQSLMWLAERYQRFLSRNDTHGAVVVDSRRPEMDERLRRFFERRQRDGTPYVRLERIVDALLLGPSSHSIGLQTADLVVASALAAQRAPGDASRYHKQLLPRFDSPPRHPSAGRRRPCHLPPQGEHAGASARETVHGTANMKPNGPDSAVLARSRESSRPAGRTQAYRTRAMRRPDGSRT
ncbi:MAG: DUF3800 domain-containing protein, partial [Solirubrobacteraceae bacterium]